MKTFLLSALALAVAAAPVFGEDQDEHKQPKKQAPAQRQAPPQRQVNQVPKSYTPKVQQQMNARTQAVLQNKPNVTRTYTPQTYTPKTYTPNVQNRPRTYSPPNPDEAVNANMKLNDPNWNRYRNRTNPNVVTNQTPNPNIQSNNNPNVRNRDWQNRHRNNNTTT